MIPTAFDVLCPSARVARVLRNRPQVRNARDGTRRAPPWLPRTP